MYATLPGLCVGGGMYVCEGGVHTRVHWVSCSISLHFIPLAKSISLNLGQAVSQKALHKPPASTSHGAELRQTQLFTPVLGSRLRPSGWCNKRSHPPCPPSCSTLSWSWGSNSDLLRGSN